MDAGASDLLRREILAAIASDGPISFARFMRECLYHPLHGYYTRGLGGGGGRDYLTSSGLHRAYGAMVARQAAQMWRLLGAPERFRFVEFGPGEGLFAADMLHAARTEGRFAEALEYVLVESSPALRRRQRERLGQVAREEGEPHAVRWASLEELESGPPFAGCLFANEVFDAFPAHRVVGTAEGPAEIHVGAEGGELVERLLPVSDAGLAAFLGEGGIRPEPGQEVDVQPESPRFVARASRILERGWFVIVDYGYAAADLYHPARRRGTLMAYHRHRASERFLEQPGEQDLTAHVDFTALEGAAAAAGLRRAGMTSQARFLLALGALEDFEAGDLREREALKDLVLPDRMGGVFRVLILATEGAPTDLRGLAAPWPEAGAPDGRATPATRWA